MPLQSPDTSPPVVDALLERPVFVAGRGRSGSSLLLRLFDGHPEVFSIPRESRLLTEVGPRVAAGADLVEVEAGLLEWFADFARDEAYAAGAARIREGMSRLDPVPPGLTRALFALVLEAVACVRDPGAARCFLEKTPKNEAHFDEMFAAFPTARVIYLVRDPRAVYLSNKRSDDFRMAPDFAARQWVKSLRSVLRQVVKFGGAERILVVRYEDLVARPGPTLEAVCGFIGVAASEALAAPTVGGRPWRGNAYGDAARGSGTIEAGRAEAWRAEIGAEENAAIVAEARFEMSLLGYPAETDQDRLIAAMATVERLTGPEAPLAEEVVLRPHRPGDMGWIVWRHGALYALEQGWDGRFEALVARICADFVDNFDPARERCWIAERGGERLGSICLVKGEGEGVAQLRLLLIEPAARGLGLGKRLVEECVGFARQAGYREVVLMTENNLDAARGIYAKAGFVLEFSDPDQGFAPGLAHETWRLGL